MGPHGDLGSGVFTEGLTLAWTTVARVAASAGEKGLREREVVQEVLMDAGVAVGCNGAGLGHTSMGPGARWGPGGDRRENIR